MGASILKAGIKQEVTVIEDAGDFTGLTLRFTQVGNVVTLDLGEVSNLVIPLNGALKIPYPAKFNPTNAGQYMVFTILGTWTDSGGYAVTVFEVWDGFFYIYKSLDYGPFTASDTITWSTQSFTWSIA